MNSVLEAIASDALDGDGPQLISVDELRAAGALDVPPSWRKSLGVERDVLPGLFDNLSDSFDEDEDEESPPAEPGRTPDDPDGD